MLSQRKLLLVDSEVDGVKKRFKAALLSYYQSIAAGDGEVQPVRYNKTYATLADDVTGVADFEDFKMNGDIRNVDFEEHEYPVTGEIEVTTYE